VRDATLLTIAELDAARLRGVKLELERELQPLVRIKARILSLAKGAGFIGPSIGGSTMVWQVDLTAEEARLVRAIDEQIQAVTEYFEKHLADPRGAESNPGARS
jgi:hypothetical protein